MPFFTNKLLATIGFCFTLPTLATAEPLERPVIAVLVDISGSTDDNDYAQQRTFATVINEVFQHPELLQQLDRCPATLTFMTWNSTAHTHIDVESDEDEAITKFLEQVGKLPIVANKSTVPRNALGALLNDFPNRSIHALLFIDPEKYTTGAALDKVVSLINERPGAITVLVSRIGMTTEPLSPDPPILVRNDSETITRVMSRLPFFCNVGM